VLQVNTYNTRLDRGMPVSGICRYFNRMERGVRAGTNIANENAGNDERMFFWKIFHTIVTTIQYLIQKGDFK
jgi:hypothetical protein